jgi:hypothetical protein
VGEPESDLKPVFEGIVAEYPIEVLFRCPICGCGNTLNSADHYAEDDHGVFRFTEGGVIDCDECDAIYVCKPFRLVAVDG